MRKEQPLAVKNLRKLHQKGTSLQFAKDLASLNSAKAHRLVIFTEGVLLFTKIANLSPSQRAEYYGDQFFGLHYNNDLAKLWNLSSSETIEAHQLSFICPTDWDYELGDGLFTLVYRGDNPSSALNKLLQGPTVIDCGMFCQLSIWFGIKYMLGEKAFNEVFGRAPFYVTQLVYDPTAPEKPYLGNPLHPFFQNVLPEKKAPSNAISIVHVHNHKRYQLKHPGGNYGGNNCVVIGDKFTIFNPKLETTSNLSRYDVEQLLLQALNAEQDVNDATKLALYQKEDGSSVNPYFGMTYDTIIKMAQSLSSFKTDGIELNKKATPLQIQFDFNLFLSWVAKVQPSPVGEIDYRPLEDEQLTLPKALVEHIPYENRASMSFSNFSVRTPLQSEMRSISHKFCLDVMSSQSVCVILTGKAGIGKTASAVSCAKELSSRGKHIIWISEVMVRGWADNAKDFAELEACRDKIRKLLASKPDAVFLDDDNLVGFSGKVLLEEIYMWYATTSGTGLFISSNEPLTFKDCYGFKLDTKYHFPPFLGYCSPQYENTILRSGMNGQCMRLRPSLGIMELSGPDRINALTMSRSGASVGIIVGAECYKAEKHKLSDVELVPAFPNSIFDTMNKSLIRSGTLGSAFDDLTPEQKKYTKRIPVTKYKFINGEFINTGIYWHHGINVKPFESTKNRIIVVELLNDTHWSGKEFIQNRCLAQLLRVVNYAHDYGGKRIILLNNTTFSDGEMLNKIKEGIPEREKERTLARIDALLFSPELECVELPDKRAIEVSNNRDFSLVVSCQVHESVSSPHALFFSSSNNRMRKLHEAYLIANRHQSSELQEAYDRRLGLVLT